LLCDEIKRQCPDAYTVLGGHQATFTAERTLLRFPSVDAVLKGEAESTFPILLRKLPVPRSLADVPSLVYRDEGVPKFVDAAPPVVDLDDLPRPAYHLVPPLSEYQYRPLLVRANILTTRGCPMRCVFCSVTSFWRAGYRRRRPKEVVDEARWLMEALGARGLDLADDTFTLHPEHVRQVCSGLKELQLEWFARSRVDVADQTLLAEMANAGCTKIFFGAESGSASILEYIGKRITPDQAVSAVRTARDNGVDSTVSFVFGFPPETRDDILCSFDLAEECLTAGARWVFFHRLTALPGTPLDTALSTNLSLAGSYSAGPEVLSHPDYLQNIKPMLEANPEVFPSFFSTRLEHFTNEQELLQFYLDEAIKRGLEPVGFFL
jgi:anaerobic magnesium-protoporphyrin IX monomethyl ester cyclase